MIPEYWKKHATTCSDEVFMDIYRASKLSHKIFTEEEHKVLEEQLRFRFAGPIAQTIAHQEIVERYGIDRE